MSQEELSLLVSTCNCSSPRFLEGKLRSITFLQNIQPEKSLLRIIKEMLDTEPSSDINLNSLIQVVAEELRLEKHDLVHLKTRTGIFPFARKLIGFIAITHLSYSVNEIAKKFGYSYPAVSGWVKTFKSDLAKKHNRSKARLVFERLEAEFKIDIRP